MKSLYGRPIFSVGTDSFGWEEVVLDASRDGRWARFEREVAASIALASAAIESDRLDEDAVEEAAQEFRYARDLITGQEMEEWLDARGLSAGDWMGHIRREVARATLPPPSALNTLPPPPAEILRIELLCSPIGTQLAESLAERAAVAAAAPGDSTWPTPPLPPLREEVMPDRAQERWSHLATIVEAEERFRKQVITAEAIRKEISHHHLDWIRIDCKMLSFADAGRAREAALCVREDGMVLDDVSADAHVPAFDSRFYLDELDPDLRAVFLAAKPVDLIGPMLFEGSHTLFRILDKVMPHEQDPEIRRRAEQSVVARGRADEVTRRVKWRFPG